MLYPAEILPQPNYKLIDCDLSAFFLIRLTNSNDLSDIIDLETGNVKLKYICSPEERIDDLSFSLFGIYNNRHITLQFTTQGKEKYMHYCAANETVEAPVFPDEFNKDAITLFWTVPINMLNNVTFDYTRSNNPYTTICLVRHTPMLWNFWHFSLRWSVLEELHGNERRNIAKRIGHSARATISHFAKIVTPLNQVLPANCYNQN
jgi:hypothetical protein